MNVTTGQDLGAAARSCRFCPMCHYADLTVTLERHETYSARGRGLILSAIEQGRAACDSDTADVMYRFFSDGLCQHVCAGHIPHDQMVIEGRRRIVAAGSAPVAVQTVKANIASFGNPWGEDGSDLMSLSGAQPRQDVIVYFGPAARVQRATVVRALGKLLRQAGVKFSVLAEEGEPGILLYQLGEPEAGEAAAREVAARIARSGAKHVVTPDADVYRALKVGFGAAPPLANTSVWHASEFLAARAHTLKFRRSAASRIAYHDPCALARFAPCMDAPRALLHAVFGAMPLEIGPWSRELARCSGECGGVPFTHPMLAEKAAEARVSAARDAGAELVVTGSPAAAQVLEGRGLVVRELTEFVAEYLA